MQTITEKQPGIKPKSEVKTIRLGTSNIFGFGTLIANTKKTSPTMTPIVTIDSSKIAIYGCKFLN